MWFKEWLKKIDQRFPPLGFDCFYEPISEETLQELKQLIEEKRKELEQQRADP